MKIEMATKQVTLIDVDDDEYIDMDLCSSPNNNNLFPYSLSSQPLKREFEFQMSEKESSTSPADDLFYKGKLLPLHLPPRLQMVEKLVQNSNANFEYMKSDLALEKRSIGSIVNPFESNISPSESSRVSSDVSPNECQEGWFSSDMNNNLIGDDLPKKSWPKKLKQMKQLWLGQRLKASRAYLKTLFNKSGCSDKFCASAASNMGEEKKASSKCKGCKNKYMKVARRNNPFDQSFYDSKDQVTTCSVKREMLEVEDDFCDYRRSFSGIGQRHCSIKASSLSTSSSGSSSSSSSFSFSSSGFYDLQLFKRSISANYDLESSIEGAIAHCKQSQQQQQQQQQQCGSKNCSEICSQFATKLQLVRVSEY